MSAQKLSLTVEGSEGEVNSKQIGVAKNDLVAQEDLFDYDAPSSSSWLIRLTGVPSKVEILENFVFDYLARYAGICLNLFSKGEVDKPDKLTPARQF